MTTFNKVKIRSLRFKKLLLCLVSLVTITIFLFYQNFLDTKMLTVKYKNKDMLKTNLLSTSKESVSNADDTPIKDNENLKYILEWSFRWFSMSELEGQRTFTKAKCEYTNCYATDKKDYLGDYTKFDAIIFGEDVLTLSNQHLPQLRLPHQKYVFASWESSVYVPVCSDRFDEYFNWTWTFRLDSDILMTYIIIRDINGSIIGPKPDMHWMKLEDMDPVPSTVRDRLKTKSKFAAWFVTNCHSKNDRENVVKNLNKELQVYGPDYQVEIFGQCGDGGEKRCSPYSCCEVMIEQNYYFYLSLENSFNPDYVTEKLLRALDFYLIPVVYGGANYTRFMPDGTYLNVKELGIKKVAARMVEIKNDFEKFAEYFKWKKYYSYTATNDHSDSNYYCNFCALLNDERQMRNISVKKNFQEWWDVPGTEC